MYELVLCLMVPARGLVWWTLQGVSAAVTHIHLLSRAQSYAAPGPHSGSWDHRSVVWPRFCIRLVFFSQLSDNSAVTIAVAHALLDDDFPCCVRTSLTLIHSHSTGA